MLLHVTVAVEIKTHFWTECLKTDCNSCAVYVLLSCFGVMLDDLCVIVHKLVHGGPSTSYKGVNMTCVPLVSQASPFPTHSPVVIRGRGHIIVQVQNGHHRQHCASISSHSSSGKFAPLLTHHDTPCPRKIWTLGYASLTRPFLGKGLSPPPTTAPVKRKSKNIAVQITWLAHYL